MISKNAKKCPHCGRGMGPQSCREVPLGFFCMMKYLIMDDSKIIHPTIEISPAERKVTAAFTVAVAEAAKIADEAGAAYAQAEQRHLDAARAAIRAGVDDAQTPAILDNGGRGFLARDDSGVTLTIDRGFVRKPVDAVKNARIRRENVAAREALADAETALRKARTELSRLENTQDRALRLAGDGTDWSLLAPDAAEA